MALGIGGIGGAGGGLDAFAQIQKVDTNVLEKGTAGTNKTDE